MVIASSMHPVLGELRTLFLEGVTRSSEIIWSSVKINWGTNNCRKAPPAIASEISYPFQAVENSGGDSGIEEPYWGPSFVPNRSETSRSVS